MDERHVDEDMQLAFPKAPCIRPAGADASSAPQIPETHEIPTPGAFFADHVQRNLPLVIRGAARGWPAMTWSAESLAPHYNEIVSVAPLQVDGPHAYRDKWLEDTHLWDHAGKEPEPAVVDVNKLLVVSATRVRMRLRKFLNLLRADSKVAATFYADGAGNLEHSFAYLRDHFAAPLFASALTLKRVDLWMGGRSVSRMHYDNLDNVFAQVVGSKTFVLARPGDGAAIQGGRRLRKARQCYTHPGQFMREGGGVLHETVLNYLGMPRPASLAATIVTLGPGDMLYLPFGWWHEVHGHPDATAGSLCASISHFYEPYYCRLGGKLTRELGPMMVNPRYRDADADADDEPRENGHTHAPVPENGDGLAPILKVPEADMIASHRGRGLLSASGVLLIALATSAIAVALARRQRPL